MDVASHFPGRIRLRDERLRKERVAARVRETLLAEPGIACVEANRRVGSVLIHYAADVTGKETLLKRVADLLISASQMRAAALPKPPPRLANINSTKVKRGALNRGMLASLLFSVAVAGMSLKKLHSLSGVVFLVLAGEHIYERRHLNLSPNL